MDTGKVGPRRLEVTPEGYEDMIEKLEVRENASKQRVVEKKKEQVTTLMESGQAKTVDEALKILAKQSVDQRKIPSSGEITPESAPLTLASRDVIPDSPTPEINNLKETLRSEQKRTADLFAKMPKPHRSA